MRKRYVLLADLLLIFVCAFGAFVLRLDWFFVTYQAAFRFFLVAALLIKPVVFSAFGLYRRYWRYASVRDLLAVVLATAAAAVALSVLVLGGLWFSLIPAMPRSVLFIDWVLTLCCIGGVRLSVRVLNEALGRDGRRREATAGPRRILVVGAGEAGAMVVREMARNLQLGMRPVGFLDDDPVKWTKAIHGVTVVGPLSSLAAACSAGGVDEVVIAMPSASGVVIRSLVEQCRLAGVSVRSMPGVYELLDGQVSVNRLRQVEINDLLRRSPVNGGRDGDSYLRDQVVLVTGAGGSIGSELCRQIARAGARRIVMLGHGENSIYETEATLRQQYPAAVLVPVVADIRDRTRIFQLFDQVRPDVVFHAAAHKHVPLMETNASEAVSNNVEGTAVVVEAAGRCGASSFVLISTDKAVAPSSVMGASKRVAELIVHDAAGQLGRRFSVVRFGNVLGSRGSVVPRFREQIERGGPVTVTHPDMTRFFMTIPEAVHLVIQAGGLSSGGELFVLDMGEPVRITDLATDLIRLSGLSASEIPIVFTGLRPGEKMHETLWEDGAVVEATSNPEVVKVTERFRLSQAELRARLDELRRAVAAGDDLAVRKVLAETIPKFVPDLEPGRLVASPPPA